jgi:dolichol-phosphate mannosyltransferase
MIRVLLCAYNEEKDVHRLLLRTAAALKLQPRAWSVLLVDDGSQDATVAEAKRAAQELGGALALELVSHAQNAGLGAALRTGFEWMRDHAAAGDIVVTFDADNTHPPEQITQLVDALAGGFDLAIASRYQPGATVAGVPAYRAALSDVAGLILRAVLPIRGVREYTCCYRAYRIELLRRGFAAYCDGFIASGGFAAVADILLRLRPLGVRATEIPIHLDYSGRVGASKMRAIPTAVKLLRLALRRRFEQTSSAFPEAAR